MSRVYVGMSGGVDSSVTAALLQKSGYHVTGVYMKNWTRDIPGMACSWQTDFEDAKKVAVQLGIKFKVFDFEQQYKQKVVDLMLKDYQLGRTPNPDIICNQEIKFKLFLNTALEDGADLIATGHYARILSVKGPTIHRGRSKLAFELAMARDKQKDQTYFLYRVQSGALEKSLMPLGELSGKGEVRVLAKQLGLVTADKKDSQGICFVGDIGIKQFLSQYVKPASGPIVNQKNQVVGQHDGAVFYTIGQRHGLGVGGGLPYYVTHKDMPANTVYVTTDLNDENLWSKALKLEDRHWINAKPDLNKRYKVRLRHQGRLIDCYFEQDNLLKLNSPQRALAAGQSAVIYDNSRVVGGAVISDTIS